MTQSKIIAEARHAVKVFVSEGPWAEKLASGAEMNHFHSFVEIAPLKVPFPGLWRRDRLLGR